MFSNRYYLALVLAIVVNAGISDASPHHRYSYDRDEEEYRPLIRLLKALRRENRYPTNEGSGSAAASTPSQSGIGATDKPAEEPGSAPAGSETVTTEFLGQRPQSTGSSSSSSQSGGNTDFSSADQIQKIIQLAQQSGSDNIGSKLPQGSAPTSVPPERISQINRGVSTILDGVGSLSLERILRGSFMFTRNDNVRSVANNVLDSIFGQRTPFTNGGASDTRN